MNIFKQVARHFHGDTPNKLDVIAVYLLAAGVGLTVIGVTPQPTASDWFLALLAADIAGGIVSNATTSTRKYWRQQTPKSRGVFIILHALVYPAIIFWLTGLKGPLGWLMLVGLATKIALFKAPPRESAP